MRAIRSYVTGLHRLADDHELAYTLLVVSIESLAQDFDNFQPQWADYDQRKRIAIDQALAGGDEDLAERVRQALLATEHVALGRRFREFALDYLESSYFRQEAQGLTNPAGRTDLEVALRQAYNLRSGYIHELVELPAILKMPGFGDTTSLDRQVKLTFQGLARLARHVIATFIQRQPKVYREEYDYRLEQPGVARIELEPRYWVGHTDNLHHNAGRRRLEGFLKQATACLLEEQGASVTDLKDMLSEVEKMLPQMSSEPRNPLERNRVHWISPQGMRVADNRRHMNSRPFSLTLPHDPLGLEAKRYHAKVPHLRSSTHAARAQPPHHLREETVPGGRPALLPSSRDRRGRRGRPHHRGFGRLAYA